MLLLWAGFELFAEKFPSWSFPPFIRLKHQLLLLRPRTMLLGEEALLGCLRLASYTLIRVDV